MHGTIGVSVTKCTFCNVELKSIDGGLWSSYTHTDNVRCCHRCAVTVLPRLLADSLYLRDSKNSYLDARTQFARAEGYFWKAVSARLSNDLA